ncbi:MAG: hypothetical protein AB1439_01430 [candidate division FCPU426 bacterium]
MKWRLVVGTAMAMVFAANMVFANSASFKGYAFEAYVVKSNGKRYTEFKDNNQATLKVKPKEEYSIVVRNPLPVRVGVAVSIDGLNSIDGKRTSPRNAKKWIIEPNSSITVSGWQTSSQTLRKFLFTEDTAAYAQWKEKKEGKPYTRNLGVIGVAWFWNSHELDMALHPPQPFEEEKYARDGVRSRAEMKASSAAPSAASAERRAGTGMGDQRQHAVTEVEFNPDAGMFSVRDVLKIYYEFASEPPEPMPFVDDDDEDGRFTPDMYK